LDRFEAKMRIVLLVCTFAMFGASGSIQVRSADVWEKADQAVLRLAPSALPTLPPIIKHDLERRGCTVPQPDPAAIGPTPDRDRLHNVIHGHFQRGGQTDWAVVCSRNRVSTILVFWGGRANNVSELAERPDAGFLQSWDADTIVFSRAIEVAPEAHVRDYFRRDEAKPPVLEHVGIEDIFLGKASTVWYWRTGKWVHLSGAG
jgi:hypothetical protein